MPDGTEDDLVTILTVKGVTKAEKAECLEEFRENEYPYFFNKHTPITNSLLKPYFRGMNFDE